MKSIFYVLLMAVAFVGVSCGDDDGGDSGPSIYFTATIGGNAFEAVSPTGSINSFTDTYSARGSDETKVFTITFNETPEAKTYTLTGNNTVDGMTITYDKDANSTSTSDLYTMEEGDFIVESFKDNKMKGTFSGKVVNFTDESKVVSITEGTFAIKFQQ